MPDWRKILSAALRPHEYFKRKCFICGEPMEKRENGVYWCKNGHWFDPNYPANGTPLPNAGDHHGDI